MKIVIKIGGVALEDEATLHKCARAVVEMAKDGHRVAVVHGGGTALTRTLKLLGKQSDFINGLRITDSETRDVAVMVLAGMVNKKVVAAVVKAGLPAVGFCGGDGMTFRARKKQTQGYDLGFVGEICAVEPRWFEAIWNEGGVPVLSSLALGSDGEYYNVNADQMASACAAAFGARQLIFLTDVEGVLDASRHILPALTPSASRELIASGVAAGGMQAKLNAAMAALEGGVEQVRIAPGAAESALERALAGEEIGTQMLAREAQAA